MPAPKDNTNAFKHGFYSKRFTTREKNRLKKGDPDLESEIQVMRVIADRIFDRLNQTGLQADSSDTINEDTLKSVNTLINAMAAISTLARSHQLITGKYLPVETAIMDALAELNAEDGI